MIGKPAKQIDQLHPFDRLAVCRKDRRATNNDCQIPTIRTAMAENGSPQPKFTTDDERTYFLAELPVHPDLARVAGAHDGAHDEAHVALTDAERQILAFLENTAKSRSAIADHLGLKSRSGHLYKSLHNLREINLIELTIPDKPQSRDQKMRITDAGRRWLAAAGDGGGS